MMPLWLQRLNRRERVLALIVAGTVFVVINLVIWSSLAGMVGRTRAELAERKTTRRQQEVFMKERGMWEKRDEWLKKNQPTLKSPVEASALLDQLKQAASKQNIVIENPAIGSGDASLQYQAVFASIETKSPWQPLVKFLYEVQQPESFVVFESVSLAIDPGDPTMMRGKFKIARWFAPKGQG